ncbi:MAG: glycosyltransferase family 4 protein [Acidimicrobiales bacterium]
MSDLAALATEAGLSRVMILAWRDLDDPEAGGSELHAARIAALWAEAGINVVMRSSAVPGAVDVVVRDGYLAVRRAGRYSIFPRAAAWGWLSPADRDGLVEIWNGMPFMSPVWSRNPRIVFLHHVHGQMWRMVMNPPVLGRLGEVMESRIAPPFYRNTPVVTLSESSRQEIIASLGLPAANISVVPPGVEPRFRPGGDRSPRPLVVAVGRLVPVKRFDLLIEVLARLRSRHPDLEAVIVGEGYERDVLEEQARALDAFRWLSMPGRMSDAELVDLYRRAWVVASVSSHEGWGMTLTEAGACATPAVATRITGHTDAVEDGVTGLLAGSAAELEDALDAVLRDPGLRRRLGVAARSRAVELTWEATARGTLGVLAEETLRRRGLQARSPRRRRR